MTNEPGANPLAPYLERVAEIAPIVREHATAAERASRPADAVVEAMHDAGLFKMVQPVERGGGGLSTWQIGPVLEAMARVEGSAGWTLALGQGFLARVLSPEVVEEIYSARRVLMCGSLNPTHTRANAVPGGFSFSGKGTYASNCTHATHMMAAGLVADDGKPRFVDGAPVILVGLLPMERCEVQETWAMAGMRGTGSHDVAFEEVFVPAERVFPLGEALANLGGQLTPVSLGIAQHAIDAFIELASVKVPLAARAVLRERVTAQDQLGRAAGLLQAASSVCYQSAAEALARERTESAPGPAERVRLRLGAVMGAQLAADAVGLIFDAAGMTGAAQSAAIERCWRDVNVVRQHITLATTRYEVIGRVMLGLDAGSPLI